MKTTVPSRNQTNSTETAAETVDRYATSGRASMPEDASLTTLKPAATDQHSANT